MNKYVRKAHCQIIRKTSWWASARRVCMTSWMPPWDESSTQAVVPLLVMTALPVHLPMPKSPYRWELSQFLSRDQAHCSRLCLQVIFLLPPSPPSPFPLLPPRHCVSAVVQGHRLRFFLLTRPVTYLSRGTNLRNLVGGKGQGYASLRGTASSAAEPQTVSGHRQKPAFLTWHAATLATATQGWEG